MKLRQKPNMQTSQKSDPLVIPDPSGAQYLTYPSEIIESMRYMVMRVSYKDPLPDIIGLVSALRGEGVSYLSLALGATLANDLNCKVCVVELNWWWPSACSIVTLENPGLAGVVAGKAALEDVIIPTKFQQLSFLPAGAMPPEQRPVVARSKLLKELLEEVKKRYDYIVLDVPAIRASSDSVPLLSLSKACGLVVHQGVTGGLDVRVALDEIAHLKILGVIMNRVKFHTPAGLMNMLSTQ